jgi:hypothetical protein
VSNSSRETPSSEAPVEIGPAPYYHRSDCNICRKQDDLKTGSKLLDVPLPLAAAPAYDLVQRGRSGVDQDPRAVRPVLTAAHAKEDDPAVLAGERQ